MIKRWMRVIIPRDPTLDDGDCDTFVGYYNDDSYVCLACHHPFRGLVDHYEHAWHYCPVCGCRWDGEQRNMRKLRSALLKQLRPDYRDPVLDKYDDYGDQHPDELMWVLVKSIDGEAGNYQTICPVYYSDMYFDEERHEYVDVPARKRAHSALLAMRCSEDMDEVEYALRIMTRGELEQAWYHQWPS